MEEMQAVIVSQPCKEEPLKKIEEVLERRLNKIEQLWKNPAIARTERERRIEKKGQNINGLLTMKQLTSMVKPDLT